MLQNSQGGIRQTSSCPASAGKIIAEHTLLSRISARWVRVTCANSRHMRCVRRQLSGNIAQISALAFRRRRSQE